MGAPALIDVQCCIVGGGPAGIVLGFLLARAGVRVPAVAHVTGRVVGIGFRPGHVASG